MPSIYCEGKLFFVYVCKNIIDFLFLFIVFRSVPSKCWYVKRREISCKTLCLFFSAMLGIIVLVHNPIETKLQILDGTSDSRVIWYTEGFIVNSVAAWCLGHVAAKPVVHHFVGSCYEVFVQLICCVWFWPNSSILVFSYANSLRCNALFFAVCLNIGWSNLGLNLLVAHI